MCQKKTITYTNAISAQNAMIDDGTDLYERSLIMSKDIRIPLTDEHIVKGVPNSMSSCPVAKCLSSYFGKLTNDSSGYVPVYVGGIEIHIDIFSDTPVVIETSVALSAWIDDYDSMTGVVLLGDLCISRKGGRSICDFEESEGAYDE